MESAEVTSSIQNNAAAIIRSVLYIIILVPLLFIFIKDNKKDIERAKDYPFNDGYYDEILKINRITIRLILFVILMCIFTLALTAYHDPTIFSNLFQR